MRQKGQTILEFALVLPWLFLLFFAIIYGAWMFEGYLQYNNAARDAARDISIRKMDDAERIVGEINGNPAIFIRDYVGKDGTYRNNSEGRSSFYVLSDVEASLENGDITIALELKPPPTVWELLKMTGLVSPITIIRYSMRLEPEREPATGQATNGTDGT